MSTRKLLDDCFLHDRDRLRHADALALLRDGLKPVVGTETVALTNAVGRIIAKGVVAPRPVPPRDNAAVDGYAFGHQSYIAHGGRLLVADRIVAGSMPDGYLEPSAAVRIFTGAVVPEGLDTVAMQEDCTRDGEWVQVPDGLRKGANYRLAGEDLAKGDEVAAPGRRLRPQDLAAIASTGLEQVAVHRPLTITVFSTGDEIVEPGEKLVAGQVYDANKTLLKSLASTLPVIVVDGGILPDNELIIRNRLAKAAETSHAIVTTGGASRGEEDHLAWTLDQLGTRKLWQLAIKPGRPMMFGRIGDSAVFGLPGNPVAAFVCFLLYVRPALLRLGGASWSEPQRFPLPAAFEMKKKPDRREFLRGMLTTGEDGPAADKFARDGSGLLTGLREADGLIDIDEEVTGIAPGDPVNFVPFSQFGL